MPANGLTLKALFRRTLRHLLHERHFVAEAVMVDVVEPQRALGQEPVGQRRLDIQRHDQLEGRQRVRGRLPRRADPITLSCSAGATGRSSCRCGLSLLQRDPCRCPS